MNIPLLEASRIPPDDLPQNYHLGQVTIIVIETHESVRHYNTQRNCQQSKDPVLLSSLKPGFNDGSGLLTGSLPFQLHLHMSRPPAWSHVEFSEL